MMEIWQLTDKGVKECYRLVYSDNQHQILIDRSAKRLKMFTLDAHGMEQNDITLHEGGIISGSPLSDEAKDKVYQFLRKLNVKGY
jgi:hypothetical protein